MSAEISQDGGATSRLDQRRRSANAASNESYAAKQREIIEAAARLFADRGYDATNLGDIARAVKMDRATLYYYFKSKTHLLGSAMIDALSGAVAELNRIVDSDADALSKLRAAIRCIVTAMAEKHPFSALYFQDDIWRSPRNATWISPLREDDARITRVFKMIIDDGQHDGTIRDDIAAELITRVVFGSLAWTYRWYKPDGAQSVEEVVQSFDLLLAAGVSASGRPVSAGADRS